jgi:hypothetical protein
MDIELLNAMIVAVKKGVADKLTKGVFTVYKVGDNLIRIDIKIEKQKLSSVYGEVHNAEQVDKV